MYSKVYLARWSQGVFNTGGIAMTFRRYLILIALGLALTMSVACDEDNTTGPTTFYAEEPFSFGFAVEARSQFSLQAINGAVEIVGVPGSAEITVAGVRRVGSTSVADAEVYLDSLIVKADSSQTTAFVWTEQPDAGDGRDYVVDYRITLPDDFNVSALGANGNVDLMSLRGGVTVAFANATISGSAIEGDATMSIANGKIMASVTLLSGSRVDLGAANGDIRLRVPVATSAEVDASLVNGDISTINLTLTDEIRTATSLSGTLGGGDGLISIGVANGSIVIEGF